MDMVPGRRTAGFTDEMHPRLFLHPHPQERETEQQASLIHQSTHCPRSIPDDFVLAEPSIRH
jgi:hypothetical protein